MYPFLRGVHRFRSSLPALRKHLASTNYSPTLQIPSRMSSSCYRIEWDALGELKVPADKYYGAQTVRASMNFNIGGPRETMPHPLLKAFGILKRAAAEFNKNYGLDPKIADAIIQAADELADGKLNDHFPLSVWQTASGTHTDMNVNEVISNRAIEIMGGKLGSKDPVHPDVHVNMNQSSEWTFPAAMKIAALAEVNRVLLPGLQTLCDSLATKAEEFKDVKLRPTHTKDSMTHTLGQVFNNYAQEMKCCMEEVKSEMQSLHVSGSGEETTKLVLLSEQLHTVAETIQQITNAIYILGSGSPAFRQLNLPQIATQCELIWAWDLHQVMGNSEAVRHGHYNTLIIRNVLNSVQLLGDASMSLSTNCVAGITANTDSI